ncbi:MAG: class I SAM-dependent methyltransferase [Geobacteraceae bacterium]|nr:class I SAM-dependent methyltransferase [Geobacteraceae bacterium]
MSLSRADQYQSAYLADYGFESVMVHYRRKLLLERLEKYRPAIVVEIGCGSELLYEAWLKQGGAAERWVTVEPASQFAELARTSNLPKLQVICDFFENAVDEAKKKLTSEPDMVICSCLLHEVPSASELLLAIARIMGEHSLLHLNVPNSESFHRRLAKSMGLIVNTKAMSDRSISLLQNRVYDMQSLRSDLAAAGLEVIEEGGYLIKPFTHKQMEQTVPVIGDQVLDGLYLLGKELPDQASEIFVEARRLNRE